MGLGGKKALEMVLDRLIEESRETHAMRERLGDRDGDLRSAEKKFLEVAGEVQRLRAEQAKREQGDPKLQELWTAAETAHGFIRDLIAAAEPNERAIATRARLKKALDESEKFVDLIPF